MSAGCSLHPGGGYGCPNCDRINRRSEWTRELDLIDELAAKRGPEFQSLAKYAAEIRRLRAQRDELAGALREMVEWGKAVGSESTWASKALRKARAALAKVKP